MGDALAGGQLLNLPPAGSREQPCTLVELRARLPPSHQRAWSRKRWRSRPCVTEVVFITKLDTHLCWLKTAWVCLFLKREVALQNCVRGHEVTAQPCLAGERAGAGPPAAAGRGP